MDKSFIINTAILELRIVKKKLSLAFVFMVTNVFVKPLKGLHIQLCTRRSRTQEIKWA